jgi:hypothetical protein
VVTVVDSLSAGKRALVVGLVCGPALKVPMVERTSTALPHFASIPAPTPTRPMARSPAPGSATGSCPPLTRAGKPLPLTCGTGNGNPLGPVGCHTAVRHSGPGPSTSYSTGSGHSRASKQPSWPPSPQPCWPPRPGGPSTRSTDPPPRAGSRRSGRLAACPAYLLTALVAVLALVTALG